MWQSAPIIAQGRDNRVAGTSKTRRAHALARPLVVVLAMGFAGRSVDASTTSAGTLWQVEERVDVRESDADIPGREVSIHRGAVKRGCSVP
jgi:hypothetical protein